MQEVFIMKVERDEIVEELLKSYIEKNLAELFKTNHKAAMDLSEVGSYNKTYFKYG